MYACGCWKRDLWLFNALKCQFCFLLFKKTNDHKIRTEQKILIGPLSKQRWDAQPLWVTQLNYTSWRCGIWPIFKALALSVFYNETPLDLAASFLTAFHRFNKVLHLKTHMRSVGLKYFHNPLPRGIINFCSSCVVTLSHFKLCTQSFGENLYPANFFYHLGTAVL